MEWEIMAKLKIVSHVYIHAPTTDGLSAFLTEFLYTNNLALVGGWLPYKTFTERKLEYLEFSDFANLVNKLRNISRYISEFKRIDNKKIINNHFSVEKVKKEWINVFEELQS